MNKKVLVTFVLLIASHTTGTKADEISELKELVLEQSRIIQHLQERVEQLEVRQKLEEQSLTQRIEEVAERQKEAPALPDSIKWVENVKISGDLRYRHEHIDEETSGSVRWKNGRDRHRVRARLMLEGKVNDDWDVGVRLATGSADPASTNQTLEDSFSSKELWLDLAYFNWHPASREGLNVYGGKMKNPFYKVGGNQLIWDGDLNPEGIAAKYVRPFGKNSKLYINGGGFWVDENSSGVDTSLWGIQTYIKHTMGNSDYILGGISYFDYGNIKGRGDLKSTWSSSSSFYGNTKTAANQFTSDFDIFEAFVEYGTKCFGMPVAVYGDLAHNLAANSGDDTGWLIGTKINKAKKPGSWKLSYDYRDLEADAVVGSFCDSDFIGGGTNGKGHRFGFKYQLAKNLQAALTYFHNEYRASVPNHSGDYRRLQADLLLKF